jgi:hypothetical protein
MTPERHTDSSRGPNVARVPLRGLRTQPPKTVVTLVVSIDHPEWVGDGDDERIAVESLRQDVRHEDRIVRVVEVETIPGERG